MKSGDGWVSVLGIMLKQEVKGIYVPNLIPYDREGKIYESELQRLIHWLIEKGVNGLYPNGSTGEFIRLSFEERLRVVEIIADANRGRIPILAGASEGNLDLTLRACARYHELGCIAVSLTGPYYYKVTSDGVETYFREVARETPIPILIYNIPQFANEIPLDVVERLAGDCPQIIGTKDSSRDMPRMMHILNAVKKIRPDFAVLSGTEEILLPSLMMGADGGTIASAGIVPEAITGIHDAYLSGDLERGKRLQFMVIELIESMLYAGNFPDGFRMAATLRGFEMGKSRQPHSPEASRALEPIRERIACLLADCGVSEAGAYCPRNGVPVAAGASPNGINREQVEAIVKQVWDRLNRG